jgi:hypothetical protein
MRRPQGWSSSPTSCPSVVAAPTSCAGSRGSAEECASATSGWSGSVTARSTPGSAVDRTSPGLAPGRCSGRSRGRTCWCCAVRGFLLSSTGGLRRSSTSRRASASRSPRPGSSHIARCLRRWTWTSRSNRPSGLRRCGLKVATTEGPIARPWCARCSSCGF